MKARRMDSLADHVIAKLKNEQSADAVISSGESAVGGGLKKKRPKVEPSWKTDKRVNPNYNPNEEVHKFQQSKKRLPGRLINNSLKKKSKSSLSKRSIKESQAQLQHPQSNRARALTLLLGPHQTPQSNKLWG